MDVILALCQELEQSSMRLQDAIEHDHIADVEAIINQREPLIVRIIEMSQVLSAPEREQVTGRIREILMIDAAVIAAGMQWLTHKKSQLLALRNGANALHSYHGVYDALREEARRLQ